MSKVCIITEFEHWDMLSTKDKIYFKCAVNCPNLGLEKCIKDALFIRGSPIRDEASL